MLLNVASGRVVFTTIQKFMPDGKGGKAPELSKRRNIIMIADEAHRSQYDLIDGLARNLRESLPNASFIGFTATPIEKTDANTRAVFGDLPSQALRECLPRYKFALSRSLGLPGSVCESR